MSAVGIGDNSGDSDIHNVPGLITVDGQRLTGSLGTGNIPLLLAVRILLKSFPAWVLPRSAEIVLSCAALVLSQFISCPQPAVRPAGVGVELNVCLTGWNDEPHAVSMSAAAASPTPASHMRGS
jgi:hypothetical protein